MMFKKFSACLSMCLVLTVLAALPCGAQKRQIKYALAILHYNLQYVAGDEQIENRIIKGALEPMVDFFLAHPDWGADFEMQGYMVEQTALRYPDIYKKLKTLLDRGQVELVSFHYSDQLFLAYPKRDLEWSIAINEDVFSKLAIKRSGVVFTQEGQFGEGMAGFMTDHGYGILALPKNLYEFLHGPGEAAPYYSLGGVKVIQAGRGVNYSGDAADVHVQWSFMNDAELLPSGGASPYFVDFGPKEEALKKYEDELKSLEAAGYIVGNITSYVSELEKAGVPATPLPPMLDGDWQPADTMNIFRWMGDHHAQYERDNEVLTKNVRTRHELLAAETAISFLDNKGEDTNALKSRFSEAARKLMLAEVSDSTGWTPSAGEVKYSLKFASETAAITDEIFAGIKKALGASSISVDTLNGDILINPIRQQPESSVPEVKCPVDISISGDMKSHSITCSEAPGGWDVYVRFKTIKWHSNNFSLKFARDTDNIVYSPALMDDKAVSYPLSAFIPEKDWLYLPMPNGLIALSDDLYIIKDTSTVHVSARFDIAGKSVAFEMLKPPNGEYEWHFLIVKGGIEKALEEAGRMNVHPIVNK